MALTVGLLCGQERSLSTRGNAQYEVVGFDNRSVSYIEELSRHVTEVAVRYLGEASLQFPQRILVSLKPEAYVAFDGNYEVRVAERGFVNLDFRWEQELDLRAACRALATPCWSGIPIFNTVRTAWTSSQSGPLRRSAREPT